MSAVGPDHVSAGRTSWRLRTVAGRGRRSHVITCLLPGAGYQRPGTGRTRPRLPARAAWHAGGVSRRVKITGDLFHQSVPVGAVKVTRPGRWGNPFTVKEHGLKRALQLYREQLAAHPELVAQARRDLAGMDLACWCKLPTDGERDLCHGAILLEAMALSNEISRVRFWEARLQQRPAGQHSPSQAPLEAYWQIVRPPVRRWLDC